MGKYDFTCEMNYGKSWENDGQTCVYVQCFWKCNGWRYHMQPVYGWVTCNGEERCMYNAGYPNFTDSNGRYALGDASNFTFNRGHSGYNVACSARLRSDSSYASGERSSGTQYVNVPAKKSTLITYNVNGGTGAPGNQTKWFGEHMWLSGTRPTKTGFNFVNWSASNGGTYSSGQEYTSDPGGTVTMTANWSEITYTVSYNANGGSGAPGNQTKRYTTNLTLSNTKPTKSGYIFKGWATSSNGAVVYQPGDIYKNNAAVTLHAVWEIAYKKPTISNLSAFRCNSGGTASDTGTYVKVSFSWTTFNNMVGIDFRYKAASGSWSSWTSIKGSATGKSGSINTVAGNNAINPASSYEIQVRVYDASSAPDAKTTVSNTIPISTQSFPIDVKRGGKGVAIGKVAEKQGGFEIGGSINEIWLGGIKILWYS